jgi:hypothetical protein
MTIRVYSGVAVEQTGPESKVGRVLGFHASAIKALLSGRRVKPCRRL